MNDEKKDALNNLSRWEEVNFPNGSHYRMQKLPVGDFGVAKVTLTYGVGYKVTWPDGTADWISFDRASVGPGVDLGVHFCTQDQALEDLL